MAFVHGSVSDICRSMLQSEGRYAYTTPKSFLEQVNTFNIKFNLVNKEEIQLFY